MVFTGHHCITTIMNNAASFNLDLNHNQATPRPASAIPPSPPLNLNQFMKASLIEVFGSFYGGQVKHRYT